MVPTGGTKTTDFWDLVGRPNSGTDPNPGGRRRWFTASASEIVSTFFRRRHCHSYLFINTFPIYILTTDAFQFFSHLYAVSRFAECRRSRLECELSRLPTYTDTRTPRGLPFASPRIRVLLFQFFCTHRENSGSCLRVGWVGFENRASVKLNARKTRVLHEMITRGRRRHDSVFTKRKWTRTWQQWSLRRELLKNLPA